MNNKWRPLSLSELTQMVFNKGLTHLGSEASKCDLSSNCVDEITNWLMSSTEDRMIIRMHHTVAPGLSYLPSTER